MAILERINFTQMREVLENDTIHWAPDGLGRCIEMLPQIFWETGEPWHEANHWAVTKAMSTVGGDIKTVASLMTHLHSYANWLESKELDWRHFPKMKRDRAIVLYRGDLIKQRESFALAPSTVTARMAAVIQFYRHCRVHRFVERRSPLWTDRQVVIRYFDALGFERSLVRTSSELAIPFRRRHGLRLEGGLLPINFEDAVRLLEFTEAENQRELTLMLSLGFLSGARLETITTLSVKDIENAYPDVQTPETYKLRVGPGTTVETKGDVAGNILVPKFLIDDLIAYAYSVRRLKRQSLASDDDRGRLFLTIRGNPYERTSFTSLMTVLRRRAVSAGMRFMASFKFHQSRATFGTFVMTRALQVATVKAAVAFLKDAMLHKHEKDTLGLPPSIRTLPLGAF